MHTTVKSVRRSNVPPLCSENDEAPSMPGASSSPPTGCAKASGCDCLHLDAIFHKTTVAGGRQRACGRVSRGDRGYRGARSGAQRPVRVPSRDGRQIGHGDVPCCRRRSPSTPAADAAPYRGQCVRASSVHGIRRLAPSRIWRDTRCSHARRRRRVPSLARRCSDGDAAPGRTVPAFLAACVPRDRGAASPAPASRATAEALVVDGGNRGHAPVAGCRCDACRSSRIARTRGMAPDHCVRSIHTLCSRTRPRWAKAPTPIRWISEWPRRPRSKRIASYQVCTFHFPSAWRREVFCVKVSVEYHLPA